jgi:RecB family exonuclease
VSEQLAAGSAPRRLLSTYPSRLTTWLDCPAKYRLTYVDKVPSGPPWAHQSLGISIHNALRDWWSLPLPQRDAAHAAGLLQDSWVPLGYRDDAQSAHWLARATDMVTRYVATLDPADEPVGVERTVGFRTGVVAMNGRVDRIDRRRSDDGGEELVVVDYKTGRHLLSTTDARSSLALAAYAVAAARTLRLRSRRVELHHLPSGQVVVWEHDQASLERHVARIDDIASDVVAAQAREQSGSADVDDAFPARPGPLCGYCDVVRDCPTGLDAVAGRLPVAWDVLDRWEAEPVS